MCNTGQAAANGKTPLWAAVEEGHQAVVRCLLEAGDRANQRCVPDKPCNTRVPFEPPLRHLVLNAR